MPVNLLSGSFLKRGSVTQKGKDMWGRGRSAAQAGGRNPPRKRGVSQQIEMTRAKGGRMIELTAHATQCSGTIDSTTDLLASKVTE